ncbi:MAG: hypothetical protein RL757_3363 [Bacteroidota bacterium]
MKLDILAIGVHPDDVELSACGTLLKHIEKGYTVGLLDLTKGELGSRGSAEIRTQEALDAAQKMGAIVRIQLDMEDGFFTQNEENLLKIIRVIRQYQPDIVLANALDDRHPDHGRAAKLTADAAFLSGLVKIKTIENGDKHAIHYDIQAENAVLMLQNTPQIAFRPRKVYHYVQDRNRTADFMVDISKYMEQKAEIVLTYASQFHNPTMVWNAEPQTPISSPQFLEALKGKDSVNGRLIDVPYAEAFNAATPIQIDDIFDTLK